MHYDDTPIVDHIQQTHGTFSDMTSMQFHIVQYLGNMPMPNMCNQNFIFLLSF